MNRQITWKPAKDAPILKKFFNLSDDAQCILSAFYKDKRQSSKCASQRDVSSYYQDIYRKKFCLSSTQGTNTTIKKEKLSWNEQTDMGYSSQQQNFGIDFEELEGERSCVPKEQVTDCQNDEKQLFLEKENKGYGTDRNSLLCKSQNSKSNFQRYVSTTAHNVTSLGDKRQLSGSLFGTIQKSCYSNCSADIDRKTHSGTSFRDHYSKSVLIGRANCKDVNPVSLSGEVQIFEKVLNTSLPNLEAGIHGPNELTNKSTVSQFDDVSTNEENMQSSSQSLFSQDELGHKEESKFSVDCESNVQKNGIAVPVKENERTPYVIAPNSVTSISSKIARRLYQHKQKRQEDQKAETECSNVNNDNGKERKKTLTQYFVPYKKKRSEDERKEDFKEQKNQPEGGVSNVDKMSEWERKKVFEKFLQSREVAITLVYSDGSTQLRENLDATNSSNTKKKSSTVKMKNLSQVSGWYMKCRSNLVGHDDEILYIPQHTRDVSINEQIRQFLQDFIRNNCRQVCFCAKDFLIVLLKYLNVENADAGHEYVFETNIWDPIVAQWLLNPDKSTSSFQQMLADNGIQQKNISIDQIGHNTISDDMEMLLDLIQKQFNSICSKNMRQLFLRVETKLTPLLAIMDTQKIKVSTDTMLKFSDILQKKLAFLEQKAYKIVGHSFSITSPAQIRQVIFEELQLHTRLSNSKLAKTAVGHQLSTSESVLTQLMHLHPLPAVILEYRQVQKLKSTYVDGMMSAVVSGYLSTHWDQTSAATGRLSSHSPNIQAIPKTASSISVSAGKDKECIVGYTDPGEKNVDIFARDSFISHDGWSFLSADFQQIELRLLAHLANDSTLLRLFNESCEKDIFVELTAQWLRKLPDNVSSAEREQTKRIVYSVMYGAGKEKLAEYLKIPAVDAKNIIDSFLVSFPAVNHFSRRCIEFCRQKGYTESIFKRKRMIPNINHPSPPLRAQAERQAVNFCVQGSAADLCKAAMLQVENNLVQHSELRVRLLVQIHDELLFEVPDEHLSKAGALIKSVMEDRETLCSEFLNLRVPLRVSLCAGKTWGHMTPLQNNSSQ